MDFRRGYGFPAVVPSGKLATLVPSVAAGLGVVFFLDVLFSAATDLASSVDSRGFTLS